MPETRRRTRYPATSRKSCPREEERFRPGFPFAILEAQTIRLIRRLVQHSRLRPPSNHPVLPINTSSPRWSLLQTPDI